MHMHVPALRRRRFTLRLTSFLLLATILVAGPAGAARRADAGERAATAESGELASLGWMWPAASFRLVHAFVAPAHRYGPGHRGIDLEPLAGAALRAPADGAVAFAGQVAGRGILTIDHGGGLVTTLEPVSTTLAAGTHVVRGTPIALLTLGGHATPGTLHFGVRLHGEYINPMLLLGGVPRAVLLPCC